MSYGTILLMAIICLAFGGADRTSWGKAPDPRQNAPQTVAPQTAAQQYVPEADTAALSDKEKPNEIVRLLSAPSSVEEPPLLERQWYAYLRYRSADMVSAFAHNLLAMEAKCETEP